MNPITEGLVKENAEEKKQGTSIRTIDVNEQINKINWNKSSSNPRVSSYTSNYGSNNNSREIKNLNEFDYVIKLILVGESAVGKTNICRRYCYNEFQENSKSTTSFESLEKITTINNERIKACIWDTLGQEKFATICNQYYRATNGALFIFDLSNYESFQKIDKWIDNYNNYSDKGTIIKFLIGNKADLNTVKVTKNEVSEKIKKYEFDAYYETSALANINVNETFEKLIQCRLLILLMLL